MPDGVPAPAPAPQLDAQERFTQERFKAWYGKGTRLQIIKG